MDYNDIAKAVHNLVKNPQESNMTPAQLNTHEGEIIEKVFSDFKTSGDVMAFESIPLYFWL